MATKKSSNQTKKAGNGSFKNLLPALLFGTAIVVTIGLIGRKATKS